MNDTSDSNTTRIVGFVHALDDGAADFERWRERSDELVRAATELAKNLQRRSERSAFESRQLRQEAEQHTDDPDRSAALLAAADQHDDEVERLREAARGMAGIIKYFFVARNQCGEVAGAFGELARVITERSGPVDAPDR